MIYFQLQIPPEDIRWEGLDSGISYRGHNGQGRGTKRSFGRGGPIASAGRGRGMPKGQGSQFRKDFMPSHNRLEKVSDDIELLNTETLVKEV